MRPNGVLASANLKGLTTGKLVETDFDVWSYVATRDGVNIDLQIKMDDPSLQHLELFRADNQDLAEKLLAKDQNLDVRIVLNQPISVAQTEVLVADSKIELKQLQLRIIDGHGDRVTLFSEPNNSSVIDENFVNKMLEYVENETGKAELLGIITIDGMMPSDEYDSVIDRPDVYMIDLTPTYVVRHFQQNYSHLLRSDDFMGVTRFPTYWYLENNSKLIEGNSTN